MFSVGARVALEILEGMRRRMGHGALPRGLKKECKGNLERAVKTASRKRSAGILCKRNVVSV